MVLKKFFLRVQNRIYISVILFLGAISLPALQGCDNPADKEKEQQRIKDSIASAQLKQDSINKIKQDSIATANREKAMQDSIRIADSIAKAKKHQKPANPFKPVTTITKYGVPANLRND